MNPPVLDAGAITALAARTLQARERLRRLRSASSRPPLVPSVVLTEALQGDLRKDHLAERLLAVCEVRPVEQVLARQAARLRTASRRGSAVDAIVVAMAAQEGAFVLTGDVDDIQALAEYAVPVVQVRHIS